MAETKTKGDLGQAMIMAEAMKRGYKVAIPVGEDWRYDLIVLRQGKLERVQCKYTESDGQYINVRCRSSNNWQTLKYTADEIDWLAVYDKTTDQCYFVPASELGDGKSELHLRVQPPKNGQVKKVRLAEGYKDW